MNISQSSILSVMAIFIEIAYKITKNLPFPQEKREKMYIGAPTESNLPANRKLSARKPKVIRSRSRLSLSLMFFLFPP